MSGSAQEGVLLRLNSSKTARPSCVTPHIAQSSLNLKQESKWQGSTWDGAIWQFKKMKNCTVSSNPPSFFKLVVFSWCECERNTWAQPILTLNGELGATQVIPSTLKIQACFSPISYLAVLLKLPKLESTQVFLLARTDTWATTTAWLLFTHRKVAWSRELPCPIPHFTELEPIQREMVFG